MSARNRPPATKFHQQELAALQPVLTPRNVMASFAVLGVACLGAGLGLLSKAASVVEVKAQYDGPGAAARYGDCRIDGPGRRGNQRFALLSIPRRLDRVIAAVRAQASGSAPRAPCASRRPRT